MRNGARPTKPSHKDYDFLATHKFGATVPDFADEYNADAGLTMPNQMQQDNEFVPPTPALPEGCTDFAQADLATDLTRTVHNPIELENVTHANARGGIDIRTSLDGARSLGWFQQYFNVVSGGLLDFFDALRTAQVAGIAAGEFRAITWGTPWFASWERAIQGGQIVMPMPLDGEISAVNNLPWHNSALVGWKLINGITVYQNKSWQGNQIGDKGYVYFPREVINRVMQIPGTVAYVATNTPVAKPVTVSLPVLQWILSLIRSLLSKYVK